jgi:hypothetical protein
MYLLTQTALASALLSMTTASPLEQPGSFSVAQVPNPNFVLNGPAAYAGVFLKYNMPMPHDLAVATGNNGSVTATPANSFDSEYLSPVSIDGQILNLQFDSGSSDL